VAQQIEQGRWNPRPSGVTPQTRSDYYAGYSDGWHGYPRGAGIECLTPSYREGFDTGRSDRVDA